MTRRTRRRPSGDRTVVILGSGPNRIGQGVEFDYCCVRAVLEFRRLGYRTVMVNSNPETVSTDFDISDALYFEPLTLEDVLEIVALEKPIGVVVQLGGQTPLRLARGLEKAGVRILGTSPDSIDAAEDREKFEALARRLGVRQPEAGVARSVPEAVAVAARIGYPVLVRPSYVLGGRAMEIVYDDESLMRYFERAARVAPEHPVLIDRFLEDAFEADVDAISDGVRCTIGGVMQHIEDAGIHSGDSACVMPPYLIKEREVEQMRAYTRQFALALGVVGLINVQYAIKDGVVYVLEVNPRGSRTVPFVSKTTGVPLASMAAAVMVGKTLDELGLQDEVLHPYVSVKEAVFPFSKLPGVDLLLGPEMRSTGEVMGIADGLRDGIREGPGGGGRLAAARGRDLHHRERQRQGHRRADRAAVPRAGIQDLRDPGHGASPARARRAGRAGAQGARGTAQRHRPARVRPDPHAGEHAAGQADPAGRLRHAPRRAAAPRRVHHDHVGRIGGVRCHHRAAQPDRRGALAAGVARAGPRNDR